MDFNQAIAALNWPAIIVSALSAFALGGLWYSPALFAKQWMAANNFTEEGLKEKGNTGMIFGVSCILALIAAFFLAMFIGPTADWSFGATAGFMAGLGWVATYVGMHYLYERRPLLHYLINAGYSIISLTIMGAILGAWH